MPVSRLLSFALVAVIFVQESLQQCSFDKDGFSASWLLDDEEKVHITVTKEDMDDNSWVAVGFGHAMFEGLDIAMIKVVDGEVSISDEKVFGYETPSKDKTQDIETESKSYENKTLKVKFNRSIKPGSEEEDRSIKGCTKWQFATKGGPIEDSAGTVGYHVKTPTSKNVCIEKCRA